MNILAAIFAFLAGLFISRQTFTEEKCTRTLVVHISEGEFTPFPRKE